MLNWMLRVVKLCCFDKEHTERQVSTSSCKPTTWFARILRWQLTDLQPAYANKKIMRGSDLGNRSKDISHTARCVLGKNISIAATDAGGRPFGHQEHLVTGCYL
jgi:hypothetical protein